MDERRIKERKAKRKRVRVNRVRLIFTVVAIVLIITFGYSLKSIISLHLEHKDLMEQNAQLKKEKARLELELKSVNDDNYIEEKARKELNLIKPGEVLYMLENDEDAKKKNGKDEN